MYIFSYSTRWILSLTFVHTTLPTKHFASLCSYSVIVMVEGQEERMKTWTEVAGNNRLCRSVAKVRRTVDASMHCINSSMGTTLLFTIWHGVACWKITKLPMFLISRHSCCFTSSRSVRKSTCQVPRVKRRLQLRLWSSGDGYRRRIVKRAIKLFCHPRIKLARSSRVPIQAITLDKLSFCADHVIVTFFALLQINNSSPVCLQDWCVINYLRLLWLLCNSLAVRKLCIFPWCASLSCVCIQLRSWQHMD